jgi:hypothetical protein
MKNEVKRKMMLHMRSKHALKSPQVTAAQKFFEHSFTRTVPHADEHK